ncbi:inorganic phosphate transporter [Phormidium tenue FACHB-886]|nr:inorganic phosphate transporter [Phormidium tenue FACHB-886]
MDLFGESLSTMTLLFLLLALGLALTFEFVNGFHDTANAVATVIYTQTLQPTIAVIWSGIWNLVGVLTSSGAVAFSVLALLPAELVLNVSSGAGFAMVFSLLVSAILWNLGTWYLGLPASSSHTLIGSILGVGLANSLLTSGQEFGAGVNWAKAEDVFVSLLASPAIGFCGAALLLLLLKGVLPKPELYSAPEDEQPPPWWIRVLLILTCTGVSFAHGSNDGQKGMGLILLILIGILPGLFAVNLNADTATIEQILASSQRAAIVLEQQNADPPLSGQAAAEELSAYLKPNGTLSDHTLPALAGMNLMIRDRLASTADLKTLSKAEKMALRNEIYLAAATIGKLDEVNIFAGEAENQLLKFRTQLDRLTQFIPLWVKVAVAVALGLGTTIGWKRIVTTVGEKIGKDPLSYAQGASAEVVAMGTILAADVFGLPVSTTHVLSSGVAGTMAANHSGLQLNTLRNLLTAWLLTLPVCILLSAAIFRVSLFIWANSLGLS